MVTLRPTNLSTKSEEICVLTNSPVKSSLVWITYKIWTQHKHLKNVAEEQYEHIFFQVHICRYTKSKKGIEEIANVAIETNRVKIK